MGNDFCSKCSKTLRRGDFSSSQTPQGPRLLDLLGSPHFVKGDMRKTRACLSALLTHTFTRVRVGLRGPVHVAWPPPWFLSPARPLQVLFLQPGSLPTLHPHHPYLG